MLEKIKVTYYIENETKEKFDDFAKKMALNKSALVELLIKEWMEKVETK